jgi:hypothetical protein
MKIKILTLLVVILTVGCNDDFLERYPLDKLSKENFWKTEEHLKLYINPLYDSYFSGHGEGFSNIGMGREDFKTDIIVGTGQNKVKSGQHTVDDSFGYSWGGLRTLNIFLENYASADETDEIKNRYAGEIKFFRALFYFDKVKKFGDVPWIDKVLNTSSPELRMARTPRKTVMENIVKDIDFAIANLPSKNGYIADDRINKEVALHLKARICLFEGTFRKYHKLGDHKKFLELARDASKSIIETKKFEIYKDGDDSYYELFTQSKKLKFELNKVKEIILAKRYTEESEIGHSVSNYLKASYRYSFTKSAIDSYLCKDGKPISTSSLYKGAENNPNYKTYDEFIDRDPRLSMTATPLGQLQNAKDSIPLIKGVDGASGYYAGGYPIKKYNVEGLQSTKIRFDAPIYRYAETLLIYAESKAELGEITQSDLDISINLLRNRVNMPKLLISVSSDPKAEFPSISPLLNEIRRERKVELMLEGLRRDDILRWKAGKLLTNKPLGMKFVQADYPTVVVSGDDIELELNADGYIDVSKTFGFADPVFDENKHYYYPIPIKQISLNPDVLKQNPGWE